MNKILLISIISTVLSSCSKTSENTASNSGENQSSVENLNIQTNQFVEIDSTGVLLFPLEMGESKSEGSSRSYKEMPDNGYWNILFFNSNTNESHLLTDQKLLILNYNYKYGSDDGTMNIAPGSNHIFYTARSKDFNNDHLIDEKDPVYLFVSDKFGKNFRQLSPDNYSVNNWEYLTINGKIIMTATKDSNENTLFDSKDESSTFELTLDKDETPKEVFGQRLKDKIKIQFDRDWKRLK